MLSVAGLKVDTLTKSKLLEKIKDRIHTGQRTVVFTPYSEFLYDALRDRKVMQLLNSADFSIADGVGILWANLFLSQALTWPGYFLKIAQSWLQMVWTGAVILLQPSLLYKTIPEKIVGADLIWDLAALAQNNNFAVFLLGAKGDVATRASKKLQEKFPGLKIAGASNKNPDDLGAIDEVKKSGADMLLVAYPRLVQEQWIAEHLPATGAKFGIGLGGSFDYIAGEKKAPPRWVRNAGLEWLYRLFTQPRRVLRIYRGVVALIVKLVKFKYNQANDAK